MLNNKPLLKFLLGLIISGLINSFLKNYVFNQNLIFLDWMALLGSTLAYSWFYLRVYKPAGNKKDSWEWLTIPKIVATILPIFISLDAIERLFDNYFPDLWYMATLFYLMLVFIYIQYRKHKRKQDFQEK